MLVNKLGVDVLLQMLCRLRFYVSLFNQIIMFTMTRIFNSDLDFLIQFYQNRFQTLNVYWSSKYNSFMLHIKVIIKLDKKTNRSQFRLSRTLWNRYKPHCMRTNRHFNCLEFQKLKRWYVGGVNMTQFSSYLYTQC